MPRQRQTRQRHAIERVFETVARPLSPTEVHELARKEVDQIGIATVYRALNDMVQDESLRAVELPGMPPRYEKSGLRHHHHFHCETCDRVYDLEGCLLKENPDLPEGFEVTGHEITLSGTCPLCGTRETHS